jgi:uncharacterized coiled-coil protein SlyX
MTGDRMLDRLMAHLRAHVAELRRLEREGAGPHELAERRQVIAKLQDHLAYAVRDVLRRNQASTA